MQVQATWWVAWLPVAAALAPAVVLSQVVVAVHFLAVVADRLAVAADHPVVVAAGPLAVVVEEEDVSIVST